jgi:hypothetical protein
MLSARIRRSRERGQVIVLFALLTPVILTFGSIVVSAGNWYVLKRHLQTQADAAALASGPEFIGCGQGAAEQLISNGLIRDAALKFSGDTLRAGQYNLQVEETGDQRAVVNSTNYWKSGDPTDGSGGLDNSLGLPCDTKFLDVKITDDRAPLLFRWIPLFPSPKARARVEAHEIIGAEGVRPLGVPEVDPVKVAVLFVNENAPGGVNSPGAIVNGPSPADRFLDNLTPETNPPTAPPPGMEGMNVWSKTLTGISFGGGSQQFNTVVVASRDPNVQVTGSLHDICTQNTTQTHCYAYGGALTNGISFIRAYNEGGGSPGATNPVVRDVTLTGGCSGVVSSPARDSNPYYNVDDGEPATGCAVGIMATVDFGALSDPPAAQPNGVCAEVTANGTPLTYSGGNVWTSGSVLTPVSPSSDNEIDIVTTTDTTGGCNGGNNPSNTFQRVGQPYMADDASGPVQYILLEDPLTGLIANSISKSQSQVKVTVGFLPPLRDAQPSDPPIRLRVWNTPSQTQGLDCGSGAGPNGWGGKMQSGCSAFQIYNQAWHTTGCGPPPSGVPAADPPDCIASQNGNFQQEKVVGDMWANPCSATPNNWYTPVNNGKKPPLKDPRWIPLFITDELAFTQSGKKYYPIRRFGGFYVTGGTGIECPGDDPPGPISGKRTLYGHFVSYVIPTFGDVIQSDELCSFTEGSACVVSLVE